MEQYVYYVSQQLVKRNDCSVEVICANEPECPVHDVYEGIDIHRLNYTSKLANTNITPSLPRVLMNKEFDIIHTHIPTPWSADWSNMAARIRKKPLVLTYHNDITGENMAGHIAGIYNKTALKLLLNRSDRIIITQDDYINSKHLQNYRDKVVTIPNGVDTSLFKPGEGSRVKNQIFFLSVLDNFHKYKGLDYLLKALADVKKQIPDVKLVVGGKGELLEYYKSMTQRLGLTGNVEFKGFLTNRQVIKYYGESELFILPSISSLQEGFGIVVLEALSAQTPVISTDIVGVAGDVIETGSGIIVPPKDIKSLTDAVITILGDENLQKKMGVNGRRLVERKYQWSKIAGSIYELYRELLDGE